jgi:hypothetical protein
MLIQIALISLGGLVKTLPTIIGCILSIIHHVQPVRALWQPLLAMLMPVSERKIAGTSYRLLLE